jgi:O-6-methylguanine DNA methyltransferase
MEELLNFSVFKFQWGWIGFVGSKEGLLRIYIDKEREKLYERVEKTHKSICSKDLKIPYFTHLKDLLKAYFGGKKVDFLSVPVCLTGISDFGIKVLSATKRIPYGKTQTYGEIAKTINQKNAVRAVGQSLKFNPVPIIIPCHRVIRADGSLGGYSQGVWVKEKLLRLEGMGCKKVIL